MNANHPHVTIVIVNWNQMTDTLVCLDSVGRLTYPSFSIVLVDNDSTDGSPEAIERWSRKNRPVMLIRNRENAGFVRGGNKGILHALTTGTAYVFLLNNDTALEPDVLTLLVAAAEQSADIGMTGPKIYQFGKGVCSTAPERERYAGSLRDFFWVTEKQTAVSTMGVAICRTSPEPHCL